MYGRLLLTPRWIALTGLLLAAVAAMTWLSSWQYSRAAQTVASEEAALREPVPLDSVVPLGTSVSGTAVGRPVVLAGRWENEQFFVENRSAAGKSGVWVVGLIRLADASAVAVVRGWASSPTSPAAGMATPVDVDVKITGFVQANEAYYAGEVPQTGDRLAQVDSGVIAARLGQPVRSGFVVLASQTPAATPPVPTVIDPPVPAGTSPAPPWQNMFYAVQWLVFAAFAIALWVRAFRDDAATVREAQAASDRALYEARLPSKS